MVQHFSSRPLLCPEKIKTKCPSRRRVRVCVCVSVATVVSGTAQRSALISTVLGVIEAPDDENHIGFLIFEDLHGENSNFMIFLYWKNLSLAHNPSIID